MSKPMKKQPRHSSNRFVKKDTSKQDNKSKTEKEFDSFRHEIYKFGLSGLDKKDQLDARVELAIKLGAKPKSWIKKHQTLGADNIIKPKEDKTSVTSSLSADLKRISKKKKKTQVKNVKQNGQNRKAN